MPDRHPSSRGWLPLRVLPIAVVLLSARWEWPRWVLMWALAGSFWFGAKWLTWRQASVPGATVGRHLAYLLLWPGLDAPAFLDPHPMPPPARPEGKEWAWAWVKTLAGLGLLFGLARLIPPRFPYLVAWVGMVGVVLVLHFGSFHLVSCAWRRAGVDAKALMDRPWASVSVSEFWGRRWNRAFRDFTHRYLFNPIKARRGAKWALLLGFFISGVVHELLTSLPALGGWGGPTLFFALQGVAMLFERSPTGRGLGLGRGWRGWAFTMVVLLAPVCLLFHPPFASVVIVPMLRFLGALG